MFTNYFIKKKIQALSVGRWGASASFPFLG